MYKRQGLDFGTTESFQGLLFMIGSDMPLILLAMVIQEQEIILRFNGKMILMNLIIADGK